MECPKCHAPMRSYERNGITVDQCTECRGVFLDRGELDHLISMESQASAAAAPAQPQQAAQPQQPQQPAYPPQQAYPPQPAYGQQYGGQPQYGGYKGKRTKSFLEELFD